MSLDSSIRYAAIQSSIGEVLHGGFRDGITPILSDEEVKMMHYYAGVRMNTRKNIEHKLGPPKYAMAEYKNLKRITIPVDKNHLLMFTTEVNNDHTSLISKVLGLIQNNSK